MDAIIAWRTALLVLSLLTFCCLVYRFLTCRKNWDIDTRDYWTILMMWCITSMIVAVSGMHDHAELNVRFACIFAATVGTFIGVLRNKQWCKENQGDTK